MAIDSGLFRNRDSNLVLSLIQQIAVLAPQTYARSPPWDHAEMLQQWVLKRVMKLVYTTWSCRVWLPRLDFPIPHSGGMSGAVNR